MGILPAQTLGESLEAVMPRVSSRRTYGASICYSRVAVASLRGVPLPDCHAPDDGVVLPMEWCCRSDNQHPHRLTEQTHTRGCWSSVEMTSSSIIVMRRSASSSESANVCHLTIGPGPSLARPRLVGRSSAAPLRTFRPFAADAPSPASLTQCGLLERQMCAMVAGCVRALGQADSRHSLLSTHCQI